MQRKKSNVTSPLAFSRRESSTQSTLSSPRVGDPPRSATASAAGASRSQSQSPRGSTTGAAEFQGTLSSFTAFDDTQSLKSAEMVFTSMSESWNKHIRSRAQLDAQFARMGNLLIAAEDRRKQYRLEKEERESLGLSADGLADELMLANVQIQKLQEVNEARDREIAGLERQLLEAERGFYGSSDKDWRDVASKVMELWKLEGRVRDAEDRLIQSQTTPRLREVDDLSRKKLQAERLEAEVGRVRTQLIELRAEARPSSQNPLSIPVSGLDAPMLHSDSSSEGEVDRDERPASKGATDKPPRRSISKIGSSLTGRTDRRPTKVLLAEMKAEVAALEAEVAKSRQSSPPGSPRGPTPRPETAISKQMKRMVKGDETEEEIMQLTIFLLKSRLFNLCSDYDELVELVAFILADPRNDNTAAYRQQALTQCFLDVIEALEEGEYEQDVKTAQSFVHLLKVLVVSFDLFEKHLDVSVGECLATVGMQFQLDEICEAADVALTKARLRRLTTSRSMSPGSPRASPRRASSYF
jgi:hypothetical protein